MIAIVEMIVPGVLDWNQEAEERMAERIVAVRPAAVAGAGPALRPGDAPHQRLILLVERPGARPGAEQPPVL